MFLETFSVEKWKELPFEKKKEHTFVECSGCQKNFSAIQSTYPVKAQSRIFKQIKEATPFGIAEKVIKNIPESGAAISKATTNKTAVNDAQVLLNQINTHFKKIHHNLGFAEALAKVNEIPLQLKPSKNEQKKKSRKHYQSVKENVEKRWRENDADTFLQTRISYNKR